MTGTQALKRLRRTLARTLTEMREVKPELMPLPSGGGKPRVLYFLVAYPNFSETYMHEEIRSLSEQFEIKVIAYKRSERARRHAWQYQLIEYKAPCLVYGRIEDINQEFSDPEQQDFLRRVSSVIDEFKPDVLHGHYLGMALLLKTLAERHRIPFTVRTHSMDVLAEPSQKLDAYCQAANSAWCERVLAFPFSCDRLIGHGLDPEKLRSSWPIVNFQRFYRPETRPPTRRVMCAGPAIQKKSHEDFIDLAVMMKSSSDLKFDLYAKGTRIKATEEYNEAKGNPVRIGYADPEDMPDVYPRYDWMVYPSHPDINKVGLPVGIVEAMAGGLGVCWQELPGRREEQLDFLGGAGFLYGSIDELPDILSQPYPDEKRRMGFEAARRCDIEQHKYLLSDVWNELAVATGSQR